MSSSSISIPSSDSDSDLYAILGTAEEGVQMLLGAGQVDNDEAQSSRATRRRKPIHRNRVEAHKRLLESYFNDDCIYPPEIFRRRYRMRRNLFLRIVQGITEYSKVPLPDHFRYFQSRLDSCGRPSFTCLHKCTVALRVLGYGITPDAFDEFLHISERTAAESVDNFAKCVYELYSPVYLRKPTQDDVNRLYAKHEQMHGFKGMLGSIDCMHWKWEKCPSSWKGQYTRGDHGYPTVMLEAVASYDLWIWHAFFGQAGSNNDINVLNESPLFHEILNDQAPDYSFTVNDVTYNKGYYLADGIYPEWATFVKSFTFPPDEKRRKFKRFQEGARKDIERAFGVLQGRWGVIKHAARYYKFNRMCRVMYACIILHNMIVEDNGQNICDADEFYGPPNIGQHRSFDERVSDRIRINAEMKHKETHQSLRQDLVEEIWKLPDNFRQR